MAPLLLDFDILAIGLVNFVFLNLLEINLTPAVITTLFLSEYVLVRLCSPVVYFSLFAESSQLGQ